MSWLSQLLHPGQPYKNAQNTSQGYYNDAQGQLNPYNQNGQGAGKGLMDVFNQLMHPEKLEDEWSKNYTTSEHAKQLQNQAQTSGLDAASQMGLMGSSSALNNIETQGTNIMQADKQNYMKDLMEKLTSGIGLGENVYGTGANAAGQMGQNSMNQGKTMTDLKFGQDTAGGEMLGGLGKGALKILMQYLTGGMGGAGGSFI